MNSNTQTHYDLITIGAGSGGLAAAEKAAQLGKKVALIETDKIGGTCVNNGCVPKKVMWYAANLAQAVDDANDFGVPAERKKTDWAQLVKSRENYIDKITQYWGDYVIDNRITYIQGTAKFTDTHTIQVNGETFSADHIVIATGGKPVVPPVPGAELGITSDGFFNLSKQPERVAVIGGGYIGVELSGVLHALGSDVTLVSLEDRVLDVFDNMLSDVLMKEMQAQGIKLHTSFEVNKLQKDTAGISVHSTQDDKLTGFDTVIWAVGRRANTSMLGLESTSVEVLKNGTIPVDEFENTNVPGIYAIGDITGKVPLTPVAITAGRKLSERLFNNQPDSKVDYNNIPSVVFSHPPIAVIGMTEEQARRELKNDITVYKSEFTPMRHALSSHSVTTAMKLVCAGSDEKVVGIHLIGDSVDEMLQGFAVAVKMGATKSDFDSTIAVHPVSSEELVTMKHPEPDQYEQYASNPCDLDEAS